MLEELELLETIVVRLDELDAQTIAECGVLTVSYGSKMRQALDGDLGPRRDFTAAVAYDDQGVAAWALLSKPDDEKWSNINVHVRRDCRGKGAGWHVVRKLLELARDRGDAMTWGDAWSTGAKRAYERMGFDGSEHDGVMRYDLTKLPNDAG